MLELKHDERLCCNYWVSRQFMYSVFAGLLSKSAEPPPPPAAAAVATTTSQCVQGSPSAAKCKPFCPCIRHDAVRCGTCMAGCLESNIDSLVSNMQASHHCPALAYALLWEQGESIMETATACEPYTLRQVIT
jgi:hypothetical protein